MLKYAYILTLHKILSNKTIKQIILFIYFFFVFNKVQIMSSSIQYVSWSKNRFWIYITILFSFAPEASHGIGALARDCKCDRLWVRFENVALSCATQHTMFLEFYLFTSTLLILRRYSYYHNNEQQLINT